MEHRTGTERVRETVRTGPWPHVYEDLSSRDPVSLAPVELDALAEAAWWQCKTDESIAVRQRAYAAFREAKDDLGAARTAARLFHDHFYRGEGAVAVGWLRRGFRHVERDPNGVESGWLQMAEAELHLHQGPLEQAVDGAAHAIQIARDHGDADLAAVAMQIQGRALVAQGRIGEGLGLLDEAMTCVLAGELAPLYTGWVYCSVILACKDLADLRRASEWTEAARAWCEALPATTPYSQGLCRIYRGEVLALRGAWAEAEAELRRAHQQLLAHKPQGAARHRTASVRSCGVAAIWPGQSRRSCGPSSSDGIRSLEWRCCGWPRDGWRRPWRRYGPRWHHPRWTALGVCACWPPRSRSRSRPARLTKPAMPRASWRQARMASAARWSVRPRPWPRARSISPQGVQRPRWRGSAVR